VGSTLGTLPAACSRGTSARSPLVLCLGSAPSSAFEVGHDSFVRHKCDIPVADWASRRTQFIQDVDPVVKRLVLRSHYGHKYLQTSD